MFDRNKVFSSGIKERVLRVPICCRGLYMQSRLPINSRLLLSCVTIKCYPNVPGKAGATGGACGEGSKCAFSQLNTRWLQLQNQCFFKILNSCSKLLRKQMDSNPLHQTGIFQSFADIKKSMETFHLERYVSNEQISIFRVLGVTLTSPGRGHTQPALALFCFLLHSIVLLSRSWHTFQFI